jgi:hypothetical protein
MLSALGGGPSAPDCNREHPSSSSPPPWAGTTRSDIFYSKTSFRYFLYYNTLPNITSTFGGKHIPLQLPHANFARRT